MVTGIVSVSYSLSGRLFSGVSPTCHSEGGMMEYVVRFLCKIGERYREPFSLPAKSLSMSSTTTAAKG